MLMSFVIGQEYTSINPRMKSIIFPGLGEYSLGKKEMAKNFFIREASLWIFFLGSKKSEDWYKRDYNALAELHADVNMEGKSYLFAVNIGHYNSLLEYNESKERQRLPDSRYSDSNFYWNWDSEANRIKYDQLRIKSVTAKKYTKFSIAGIILHRLISLINVIYIDEFNGFTIKNLSQSIKYRKRKSRTIFRCIFG